MAGRIVHFEFEASDIERAKRFYEELFGWSFSDLTDPVRYSLIDAGDSANGGVYLSEGEPDRHFKLYFDIDDIDAALEKVRALGGEAGNKQPISGVAWVARCFDSEGNELTLFESDESAA